MSWTKRSESYRQIEKSITSGTVTLESLLHQAHLTQAIAQRSRVVVDFLRSHIRDVIHTVASAEKPMQKLALSALTTSSGFLKDALLGDVGNLRTLLDDFYSPGSDQFALLQVMDHLLTATDGAWLADIPDPISFFRLIIDKIGNAHFYEFLFSVLWVKSGTADRFLFDIQFDRLVFTIVEQGLGSVCVERGFAILRFLIANNPQLSGNFAARFRDPAKVSRVLGIGLDSATNSLAEAAFRFVLCLCQGDLSAHFDDGVTVLKENCFRICLYIERDHTFTSDKRFATELLILVVSTRNIADPFVFTCAAFLFHLFFELPTNSFLHCSVLALVGALSRLPSGFPEFLASSDVKVEILRAVAARERTDAANWGAIQELAGIVNKVEGLPQCAKWDRYIADVWSPTREIINADYGGRPPVAPKDEDGLYQCAFLDSIDLLAGLLHSSDGSSSSSLSSDEGSGSEEESSGGDRGGSDDGREEDSSD
jgi:hypothetical protein